jgi:hypothetical protein
VLTSDELTSANENAVTQNRKTIAPADVFKALEDLEFPDFKPRLEMELAREFCYSLFWIAIFYAYTFRSSTLKGRNMGVLRNRDLRTDSIIPHNRFQ